MTGKTLLLLLAFLLLFLMIAIPVWHAIRVMRLPEKDRNMRRVIAEQRGAEYEAGMQKFLMVNYLATGIAWALAALLQIAFNMETFPAMLISTLALSLALIIAKWRYTREFSKLGFVAFAIGLVLTVVLFIVN